MTRFDPPFEHVDPDQLQVGDIVMCFRHDDQHEQKNARITAIERDDMPDHSAGMNYTRITHLTCRHVSLKRLDASGGPAYSWHRYPWNKVARYKEPRP